MPFFGSHGSLFPASYVAAITDTTRDLFTAGGILVASFIAGLIVERILIGSVNRFSAATSGKLDDVIASAIKGVARWGFLLIGIYYAFPFLPLPESFDRQITVGFRLAVLVLAIVVVARFASGVAAHYATRLLPSTVSLARVVVNVIVFTIGLLMVFQTMGIQIAPIITALGVGGLAVALALQDTLANFFAGIQILASKQIRTGDYVRLDNTHEGVVYDVGWRTTTLRVPSNHYIIVPNTKMAQAVVSNFSVSEQELGMSVTLVAAYTSDLAMVEQVAIDAAKDVISRTKGAIQTAEPVVRFHTFTDWGVRFDLVIRVREFTDQFLLKHELIKAVQKRFAEEGILIPSPFQMPPYQPRNS